jgi:hypothetical protein
VEKIQVIKNRRVIEGKIEKYRKNRKRIGKGQM